ncbi:hypothetical protein PR002_g2314 [Phytophthora rubi]|uniref:Uncharacterized protein n=1 Tax=Phytophthora rubi TaxID=129364 RepID=A0A6A3NUW7_9STRA|nr:hypothetical protein PR002_g2314 [Phytophthora rubi]
MLSMPCTSSRLTPAATAANMISSLIALVLRLLGLMVPLPRNCSTNSPSTCI